MSDKYAAKGATIEIGGPASGAESYAVIDGVQSLGIPSDSADLIDVSSHDSPTFRKQYVNGMIDSDDLSVTLVYDSADTEHEECRAAAGGVSQHFRITLSGAASNLIHTFDALVTGFAIDLPYDGAIMATMTLKRDGADVVT